MDIVLSALFTNKQIENRKLLSFHFKAYHFCGYQMWNYTANDETRKMMKQK